MALPGKTIFDVTMMAGWAFAAVLIGLVALTLVDDNGDTADKSSVVATLDNAETRLVTGSVPDPSDAPGRKPSSELIEEQNQSYDPFIKSAEQNANQMQDVLAELRSLKQEVASFHVSISRMRVENNRLRQRLAKVELGDGTGKDNVRVVELPRRDDPTSIILNGRKLPKEQEIDFSSTGSIRPAQNIPEAGQRQASPKKPVSKLNASRIQVSEEPLSMDLVEGDQADKPMMPRIKPIDLVGDGKLPEGAEDPVSEVVDNPPLPGKASQTTFAVDLGQFISFSEIKAAWKEISNSQSELLGDLSPRSWVSQGENNRLALDLIVGPLQNAADAAALCARLKFQDYACNVATYRGQELAEM
ncbi:hypothetical protein SAMN04515647_3612 [Cohaesibacter sp. ES.047]|uniref:hypothetical protein n=1 Tax=Cohaesibacter sp. ES.047 TaxID=1798205 RepID=UPI000BB6AC63|nr:hypothetical protein [Cohaesibacter sp. ES.047]SNY93318.1 hypothetical protein SAMN04515647_3612 [Cohaesibacter sp. ES.047]